MGGVNWSIQNEFLAPWIVIAPLLFFTVSIFVLHLMIKGIKKEQGRGLYSMDKRQKNEPYEHGKEKKEIDKALFIPVSSKSIEKGLRKEFAVRANSF